MCMYKATFDLEAITPIFMRGADQRKAEIRASSIKGLMRWWFRALAGNYFGNDIAGLKKAEEYVFGSTKQRSRVVVEVEPAKSNKQIEPTSEYESYFWFSQVGRHSKPSILIEEHLQIIIKSFDIKAIEASLLSLWMALHLGGFGSRSRKFAGSIFPLKEPDTNFDVDFNFIPESNLKDYYKHSFKRIISEMNKILESLNFRRGSIDDCPKYPMLSPKTAWVFIGSLVDDPKDCIEEVGRWYLGEFNKKFMGGFRFKYADRKIVHRIYSKYRREEEIKNISANSERRPYLGLPIQFYKKFGEEHVKFTVNHWNADRRASSIIFTVNKMNNRYYPVITVLKYMFLPNYKGPVKYSGAIHREKSKIKSVGGALFILRKDEDCTMVYNHFYEELVNDLKSNFKEVFP